MTPLIKVGHTKLSAPNHIILLNIRLILMFGEGDTAKNVVKPDKFSKNLLKYMTQYFVLPTDICSIDTDRWCKMCFITKWDIST